MHQSAINQEFIHCDLCPYRAALKQNMIFHMSSSHMASEDRKLFKCSFCPITFKSKTYTKLHENNIHNNIMDQHPCECGKMFPTVSRLNRHKENVHGQGEIQCTMCETVCGSQPALRRHIIRNHVAKVVCEVCGKGITPGEVFTNHMKEHNKILRKCTVDGCGKEFWSRTAYRYHLSTKHVPQTELTCPMCSVTFPVMEKLKRHIDRQHNTPRVQCEISGCTYSTNKKYYLKTHYRNHRDITEERKTELINKSCKNDKP